MYIGPALRGFLRFVLRCKLGCSQNTGSKPMRLSGLAKSNWRRVPSPYMIPISYMHNLSEIYVIWTKKTLLRVITFFGWSWFLQFKQCMPFALSIDHQSGPLQVHTTYIPNT